MGPAPAELIFAGVIVVVLVGLAGYFGRRQWQTLRGLPAQPDLSPEDRTYYRRQAWRRLICSGLMVAFAVMLIGSYALERRVDVLRDPDAKAGAAKSPERAADQQRFINLFSAYWIVATLVLMAMLGLAALDLFAIRRYGLRHYRQIQSDRRAMLERQVAIMRSERNGQE